MSSTESDLLPTTADLEMPPPRVRTPRWGALRHRNFRLFLAGQGVSLIGTWMQSVAMTELVWRQTQDPFLTGLVSFSGLIPQTLLLPIAGVLVDRWNRYRLIMLTQSLAMGQAIVLAGLALLDLLQVPELCVLAAILGCITSFDLPARQAFLPSMLHDAADLPNAIATNASLFHGTRFLGPAVAGLLIAILPQGLDVSLCFLCNGLSFLAVLVAFFFIRVPPQQRVEEHPPFWHGFREGLAFVFGPSRLWPVILLVAWLGLLAMPYTVVLRPFSFYHLGDQVGDIYGFLMAVSGCGSVTGALILAARRRTGNLRKRIVLGGVLVAVALALFANTHSPWTAFPFVALVGGLMLVTMVSCNTLVQTSLPDQLRGRVMSLYNFAVQGMLPFGNLLMGGLAKRYDVTSSLMTCSVASLVGVALFAFFPLRRTSA